MDSEIKTKKILRVISEIRELGEMMDFTMQGKSFEESNLPIYFWDLENEVAALFKLANYTPQVLTIAKD